ncbi:hypothetical protein AB3N59_06000 [Leptospira sp. WS92.C1]
MLPLRAKHKLKLHSILGIVSILFLSLRILIPIFTIQFLSHETQLILGRIGILLGLFAFFTGCGLGNYTFVQNSKHTELHVILMLAGLALQVPFISENHSSGYAKPISWIGMCVLIAGWWFGRKIRNRFPTNRF